MNNAPFRVGQRVVCVRTHEYGAVVRGMEYVVGGVRKSVCKCKGWEVLINGISLNTTVCLCIKCGVEWRDKKEEWWLCASRFAPISPRSIEIPESLKEQAEEMKDLAETIAPMKKEKVTI